MNAFESGERKIIPAVLIYAFRTLNDDGTEVDEVLMIHRNAKPGDFHSGKYNGLGGKCDLDESFLQTAQREFHEESGIELAGAEFKPLGVLNFPNFKPLQHQDWTVHVFAVDLPAGMKSLNKNPEGELKWIPVSKLLDLPLWDGDRLFLPSVVARKPFTGTLWYQDGKCARSEILHY